MLRRRARQGSCWAGLDFNRGPARCAGRIQRNRAGVSWHTTLEPKSSVFIPLCSRRQLRGAVPPCSPDNKVPLQGSISDKERLTVCA